jgi:hypothetical protein
MNPSTNAQRAKPRRKTMLFNLSKQGFDKVQIGKVYTIRGYKARITSKIGYHEIKPRNASGRHIPLGVYQVRGDVVGTKD